MTAVVEGPACEEWEWPAGTAEEGPDVLRPLPPDPLGEGGPGLDLARLDDWAGDEEDGRSPSDHLPSDVLATVDPGELLLAELESTDPRTVDDYHLVEMIAGYQRVAAWAQWRMAGLARRLSRRPALSPRHSLPTGEQVVDMTAQELAPRLGISRFAARRLVENGRLFDLKLEDTGAALERGGIDYPKACTLARLLKDQPDDVAWAVQQEVLPHAPHQTVTQLERAVSRAIIAIDPLRATARAREARELRRVHHPRPLPDGMASLTAVLPATDAAGLDLALEAAARSARAGGDPRTIDQLRADALALLGHGALDRGFIGEAPGDCRPAGAEAGGPSAHSAPPRDLGDDLPRMETGNSFLRTRHMPVGGIGGDRAQVRVTVPLSVLLPPAPPAGGRPGCGPPDDDFPDQGPPDDVPPDDRHDGPPVEVAELDGYGPITPDVARALAHSGGTWRRLVTDPLSGRLLDVGRSRYRPPAPVADFVRARDGTCVAPGCSTPARACEIDHVVPWAFSGRTGVDNLAALCPRDHAAKTVGDFRLRHLGDGAFEWTTPTGHHYVRHRSGRVTSLGRAEAPGDPPF
ncbi:DUF222 domain-containing protein [Georgenia wutianyii]|uniref:DUF222 domain-containing protein n=1 Tax=Georgenia wutianyii TaxID=2585135 RepID=A0ABX5VKR9_9MICO|nr:HNH endonuclease signature motif containing protein [Georgenia wutianyii]QDB79029.1 DUF222 domain-containing protein [Georgenia wutianyii]